MFEARIPALAPMISRRYHHVHMGKQRNLWVDLLQYIGLRTVSMALHSFPIDANLQTAKLLGSLVYQFDKKHRDRSLGNLRRSFPQMSEQQRQRLARQSVQQLIMLFVEVLFTTRLIRIDTWSRFVELENFDDVDQAPDAAGAWPDPSDRALWQLGNPRLRFGNARI